MENDGVCQESAIMFLHAQTALHPGSGTALGVVDLPVQRERHTQWPVIPGSALKGILRDRCREKTRNGATTRRDADADAELVVAFGPPTATADADKHAGALAVTDARSLAFPVRSLKGVFAWVTCPAVLGRLVRDLNLASKQSKGVSLDKAPQPSQALCRNPGPLIVDGEQIVLEEFDFTCVGDCKQWADWLADSAISDNDPLTREKLPERLVVLHDDDFCHFVRHATEVVARIGLDYDKKTVRDGALFYQEFLPAETLFYALVLANESRRNGGAPKSAAEILDYLNAHVPDDSVLQIGGDETIGKGLCAVKMITRKEGA